MRFIPQRLALVVGTCIAGLSLTVHDCQVLGQADLVPMEIMYNPKGSDDYEFVEFYNAGKTTLDLTGYRLVKDTGGDGLAFTFSSLNLAPGEFVVVAEKSDFFQQRYQTATSPYYHEGLNVAGTWSGGLGNKGEILILQDASGQDVFRFKYDNKNDWDSKADGLGSSLELKDAVEYAALTTTDERNQFLANGKNWRASADYHGNPGQGGGKATQSVVIHEILANTDGNYTDTIELYNPTSANIDIGGWYLSDSTNFEKYRIIDGTIVPGGGYLTFDETQFNPNGEWNPDRGAQGATEFSLSGSRGDQVYLVQADTSGNLLRVVDHVSFGPTNSGESIGRWPDENGSFTPMTSFTLAAANSGPRIGPIVVTEIMYNPGSMTNNNELEFIEIQNSNTSDEDLGDWALAGAVNYSFPGGITLTAGAYLLIVGFDPADSAKLAAFESQYRIDSSPTILGPWTGSLSNSGETIYLKRRDLDGDLLTNTTTGATFLPLVIEDEVAYKDGGNWPNRADGTGPSLTKKSAEDWGMDPDSWRSSNEFTGNPGSRGKPQREIAITEVLSHTDHPQRDTIELHNPGTVDVDIGGWYLSDTSENATNIEEFRKYQIPDGTTIAAGGYLTFDESQFNPNVDSVTGVGDPASNHFALASAYDDDVALVETDNSGNLVRIVDHVEFGPTQNGVSLGVWPDTEGRLYPMKETTLGRANTGVLVNQVVISEIHYNPGDMANASELEYVELYNTSSKTVSLENWKLAKGIEFNFSPGHAIPAESALVVVGFDVADTDKLSAFRTQYEVDSSVTVVGSWTGTLSNAGEALELQKPDTLEVPVDGAAAFYPMLLVERIRYNDNTPWPVSPDGQGDSLERVNPYSWSDTEENWGASANSPGPGTLEVPNFAPTFTSTAPTSAIEDSEYSYSITAIDSNPDDSLTLNEVIGASWLNLVDSGDGTGILSGIPLNEHVGSHILTLSVTDESEIVQQTFTIEVANTNDALFFTSSPATTAMVSRAYSYPIVTDDADPTDNLSIIASTIPSFLALTDNGDGTGLIAGTPGPGDVGNHEVTLSANDGTTTVQQTFTIVVSEENLPPTAITLSQRGVSENVIAPFAMASITATDPEDGDTHTFDLVDGTGGDDNALFSISGATLLTGTAFDFETKSSHSILLQATDNTGNTFQQAFTILVTDDSSEDADGDGMTELEEEAIGTSDLLVDTDLDGTSDVDEQNIGSNPADRSSVPSPLSLPATNVASDGWKYLDWFGLFRDTYSQWIYHLHLGWLYVHGNNTDSLWVWVNEHGTWLWTSSETYPQFYSNLEGNWLYYLQGSSSPSNFYNHSNNEWQ